MSEESSEKSPERAKGSGIEGVRQRLGAAQDKIAQIREEQKQARQALAKEIVDMAEGNKELSRKVQGQREEFGKGYREIEERKGEEMRSLVAEVQRGKEGLAAISQEMVRIKTELESDPSLNVELPSEKDIEEIREALNQGEESLKSLQGEYQELVERHRAFEQAQESFAWSPLKSAMEQVFWAHKELTGKDVTQEERKTITEEVEIETQRRADEERRLFDEGQKRQQMERNKEYLTSLREIVDKVKSEFQALRESLNERLNGLNEELRDELFLKTIQRDWSTIEKDRVLLESKVKRFFKFTRERNVQEELRAHLDDLSGEYGARFTEAENINNEIRVFEYNQNQVRYSSDTSGKNIRWVNEQARPYIRTGEKEADLPFAELAKRSSDLINDIVGFKAIINQGVLDYYKKINRVFDKQRIEDLQRSLRYYS